MLLIFASAEAFELGVDQAVVVGKELQGRFLVELHGAGVPLDVGEQHRGEASPPTVGVVVRGVVVHSWSLGSSYQDLARRGGAGSSAFRYQAQRP